MFHLDWMFEMWWISHRPHAWSVVSHSSQEQLADAVHRYAGERVNFG